MKNDRITFIDMAKGVGIILVLFGHLIYTNEYVRVWISAFHMPLFFVLAGITLSLGTSDRKDVKGRMNKRIKGLLVPYLWFSLIYLIVDIGNVLLDKITMHDFVFNLLASVTFSGKSVMWFLTALFISQTILILLQSRLDDRYVIISVMVITIVSYPCSLWIRQTYEIYPDSISVTLILNVLKTIVRAGIVLPFLTFGYYGREWYTCYEKYANRSYMRLIMGLATLAVCIFIAMNNWAVDTNNMILNDPFLYYLGGLSGSLSVICLCSLIPSFPVLEMIGRYSLVIMAVHLDMYVLWAGLKVGLLVYDRCGISYVLTVIAVCVTLILGCIAGYVVERFFPFILGRRRKKI